jgi:hypothetical protein
VQAACERTVPPVLRGYSSMVEHDLAKVVAGVRFSLPAPIRRDSSGVERQFEELRVGGSIPPLGTIIGPVAQRESGCFASSGSGVQFSLGPPSKRRLSPCTRSAARHPVSGTAALRGVDFGVAKSVRQRIVNPPTAGSNPASGASFDLLLSSSGQETGFSTREQEFNSPKQRHGPIAQLDRAVDYESTGPAFESSWDRQLYYFRENSITRV